MNESPLPGLTVRCNRPPASRVAAERTFRYATDKIGLRVRLEYADHGESFAMLLPREGRLERLIESPQGDQWWLLRLDEALEYSVGPIAAARQDEVRPQPNEVIGTDLLLIRSRWAGYEVGGPEPAPVNILLVDDPKFLADEPGKIEPLLHVAWGMGHGAAA